MPFVSLATPVTLPSAVLNCWAGAMEAQIDRHVPARIIAPRIRNRVCFTSLYLPGAALAVLAAVFVSIGGLIVKSAVLETVFCVLASVATISSEYLPGVSVASGSRGSGGRRG